MICSVGRSSDSVGAIAGTPGWSRLIGGYPGPIFLFLAGVSLALLAEARFGKGIAPGIFFRPLDFLAVDAVNCVEGRLKNFPPGFIHIFTMSRC